MKGMKRIAGICLLCTGFVAGCGEKMLPRTELVAATESVSIQKIVGEDETLKEEVFEYDSLGNKVYTETLEMKDLFDFTVYERKVDRKIGLKAENFKNLEGYNGYQGGEERWIEDAIGAYDGFVSDGNGGKRMLYYILEDGNYAFCRFEAEEDLEYLCSVYIQDSKGKDISTVFSVFYDSLGNKMDNTGYSEDDIFGYQAQRWLIERKEPLHKEDLIMLLGCSYQEVRSAIGNEDGNLYPCRDMMYSMGPRQDFPFYILEDGTYALCIYSEKPQIPKIFLDCMKKLEFRNEEGEILEEVFYQTEE